MRHSFTISIPFGLLLISMLTCACALRPNALAQGATSSAPTDVPARRPDATLTIAQPPSGATLPSGKVTVVVSYTGPPLVPAVNATELNQYHLHYLLDVNANAYLQSNVPLPLGNSSIIHTSKTQVTFDNVVPGSHLLAVVLTGSNHVSPNPPVAQQISVTLT